MKIKCSRFNSILETFAEPYRTGVRRKFEETPLSILLQVIAVDIFMNDRTPIFKPQVVVVTIGDNPVKVCILAGVDIIDEDAPNDKYAVGICANSTQIGNCVLLKNGHVVEHLPNFYVVEPAIFERINKI